MIKELNLVVSPAQAHDSSKLKTVVADNLGIDSLRVHHLLVVRKSIDARNSNIRFNLAVRVSIAEPMPLT